MRQICLREFECLPGPIALSLTERDALLRLDRALEVRPAAGLEGHYSIRAGGLVGAVDLGSLQLEIKPKIPLDRVVFMIAYAIDPARWRPHEYDLSHATTLSEAVAHAFAGQLKRALGRGLLQGYRVEEDALQTVRGRVRIHDQVSRRFGRMPPVEVRFDEFTEDVTENRLLKAAVARLRRLRLRSPATRALLAHYEAILSNVSLVEYSPRAIPAVTFTRLNDHYRPAVGLAGLILRSAAVELGRGAARASSFLVDMAQVFEQFMFVALNEATEGWEVRRNDRTFHLDSADAVVLKPDLTWWKGGSCRAVADLKYKVTGDTGLDHAGDIYQLLAYLVGTGLQRGALLYGRGPQQRISHFVPAVGRTLDIDGVTLSGTPEEMLAEVRRIALRVQPSA